MATYLKEVTNIIQFWATGVLVLASLVILARLWQRSYFKPSSVRHRKYIMRAPQELRELKQRYERGDMKGIFYHLRYKVNPYVFEEMVLTALQEKGAKIIRNKSYSGDGGVDGQFIYQGERWLIQAKKYSHHINPQHVRFHELLCVESNNKGLFVHTGKTGKQARSRSEHVLILSGRGMIELLAGRLPISTILCNKDARQHGS